MIEGLVLKTWCVEDSPFKLAACYVYRPEIQHVAWDSISEQMPQIILLQVILDHP